MRRPNPTTMAIAAAVLVLAACDPATDDAETPDDLPEDEQAPGTEELDDTTDDEQALGEDPLAELDLPDLDAMVQDGTFRGEGIVLPIPEGWQLEPTAQLQGQVLALATDDTLAQIAGQAVDAEDLPEPVTYQELLDSNREQWPQEPAVDEEIEIEGAEQAHQLRYDALPPEQEGAPSVSIVLIVAEDGDGRLGSFNYAAATEDFEDATAEQLISVAGFDGDSDPTPPQLPELPEEPQG